MKANKVSALRRKRGIHHVNGAEGNWLGVIDRLDAAGGRDSSELMPHRWYL